jgi:hypothetical protein
MADSTGSAAVHQEGVHSKEFSDPGGPTAAS